MTWPPFSLGSCFDGGLQAEMLELDLFEIAKWIGTNICAPPLVSSTSLLMDIDVWKIFPRKKIVSKTLSVKVVESETCRESWRVVSDNSAGNSMRSTPAQSTAPSAVQLHSAGHSISADLVTVVETASVSSSSSSAFRGAWQWTNTQAKSSTLRACMMECLGKAMSTPNLCCCTSTRIGKSAATSAQQCPVSCKHHLVKALTCCSWAKTAHFCLSHFEDVTSQCDYLVALVPIHSQNAQCTAPVILVEWE